MGKNVYWWSAIIVMVIFFLTVMVIDSVAQNKTQTLCKEVRIRPYVQEFFTWNGILSLNQKGKFQPPCL